MSALLSPRITLTGVDERTSRADLARLLEASPAVEIGILFSATPEGRRRYPSLRWIAETIGFLGNRCALHLCGRAAKRLIFDGEPRSWIEGIGRLQINGAYTAMDLDRARHDIGRPTITQASFAAVSGGLLADQILVDDSGGRGISPSEWKRPDEPLPVGFAGGLGPDNLATELPKIAAVARDPWWVDMESSLRDTEDWFSVDRALGCVEIFEEFRASAAGGDAKVRAWHPWAERCPAHHELEPCPVCASYIAGGL